MIITPNLAVEEYQSMTDLLMEIAEDYNNPPDITDIALAAANEIEMQFIDDEVEDEDELEEQYADFIDYMESVLEDLEDNEAENHIITPLKKRLAKARRRLS